MPGGAKRESMAWSRREDAGEQAAKVSWVGDGHTKRDFGGLSTPLEAA